MKVADITDFYSERGGGIRSHLTAKAIALARLGVEHVTIAPGRSDQEASIAGEDTARARVVRIRGVPQPYDPSYHFLLRLDRVRRLIAFERPDVLEIDSLYFAALGALGAPRRAYGVRTCFWHSDHVDTFLEPPLVRLIGERGARLAVRPAWGAIRGLLTRFDATICATRWQRAKLETHGVPRVHTIPFGVDKSVFSPEARDDRLRRDLLGPGFEDATLFVAVGRLSLEKWWPVALDAFLAVAEGHRAVLVFFGDGPERERLERRAQGGGTVRFRGFEHDRRRLAGALASADVLLHACPFETFGIGVAEAMACGLPVVVPDRGGASENAAGPSAELYTAGDPKACRRAIERLLARDPATLRAAALDAAARVLTTEQHFVRVLELYRELLAERSTP